MRIFAVIMLMLCAGCASAPLKPTRIYEVPAYTLVVMDSRVLAPKRGCCDMKNRIIYVQWDDFYKEKLRPRLETYGHEAWHLKEQGGCFHK